MSEYHGKHEPRSSTTLDELLDGPDPFDAEEHRVNVDVVLAEARQYVSAWEETDRGSDAEFTAGERLSSAFAVLDMEARAGNLPQEWQQPADGPKWTPYQVSLVSMFGTCGLCGGPRATRNTMHQGGWRSILYCTTCGDELR